MASVVCPHHLSNNSCHPSTRSSPTYDPHPQANCPHRSTSEGNVKAVNNPTPSETSGGDTVPTLMPNANLDNTVTATSAIPCIIIKPQPQPVLPNTNTQAQDVPMYTYIFVCHERHWHWLQQPQWPQYHLANHQHGQFMTWMCQHRFG